MSIAALKKMSLLTAGFICAVFVAPVLGEDKIIARHTLPLISIKDLQNSVLPGTVTNDRKIPLGGTGSDL